MLSYFAVIRLRLTKLIQSMYLAADVATLGREQVRPQDAGLRQLFLTPI